MKQHGRKNSVLLLHGIDDTSDRMAHLGDYLALRGWTTGSVDMTPNDGSHSLEMLARVVADRAETQFPAGRPFDLVCFSMGSIVGRYYLQRLGGHARVQRFVTIAGPHNGTLTAFFRHNPGSRELRPGSILLNDLNQDVNLLAQLQVTTIWTPFDLMIFPAWSSRLPFGQEVLVPVPIHPWMLHDRRVFSAVEKALEK